MKSRKYLIFICVMLAVVFTCRLFSPNPPLKTYDKEDLTENYDSNEVKIRKLISYFDSIVPSDTYVDIEMNNIHHIDIFHVIKDTVNYGGWDINMASSKADSIFKILNWDRAEIQRLKNKLDEVNCISIDNGYPHHIGFQRNLVSKFYYAVFDEPISASDSLLKKYNDGCTYIYYRDNVALEYGNGAIGSPCFSKMFLE